jgi:hypothetical protein
MDINGGQLTQTSGNPAFPGTEFTGPVVAGSILRSDGSTTLSSVGRMTGGPANAGYCVMAQSSVIKQATNGTVAGVWTDTNIIIPAQSQILSITLMVTTIWSGASTTLGIGNTVSATAYTAAGAGSASGLGPITFTPAASATAIGNWDNVGTTDVQLLITSTNTGTGVGTLTVTYIQGIDMAS